MPRLGTIPKGCAFHPRCVHAFARCVAERPLIYQTETSGTACFLHDPERALATASPGGVP
jgi:peptide/nickel transport system ATP-binding protein